MVGICYSFRLCFYSRHTVFLTVQKFLFIFFGFSLFISLLCDIPLFCFDFEYAYSHLLINFIISVYFRLCHFFFGFFYYSNIFIITSSVCIIISSPTFEVENVCLFIDEIDNYSM